VKKGKEEEVSKNILSDDGEIMALSVLNGVE
jgi:hypothetical protein